MFVSLICACGLHPQAQTMFRAGNILPCVALRCLALLFAQRAAPACCR
jgi:hypothetical protein